MRTALLIALALISTTGCVRRRLLVRSNPPGAMVHVDNQAIGNTPCGVDFVYYGTREIRLSMPGYETLTVNQPIPTPWYEIPGIDFISENLVPNKIKDVRTVSFNLARQRMAPAEEIIGRGEDLRRQASPIGVAPLGAPATASFNSQTPSNFQAPGAPWGLPPATSGPAPTIAPALPGAVPPTMVPSTSPSFAPPALTPTPASPAPFRY